MPSRPTTRSRSRLATRLSSVLGKASERGPSRASPGKRPGPVGSAAVPKQGANRGTMRSAVLDPLLKRDGDLRLRVGDRLDRGRSTGNRRDARDACDKGRLANQVAVGTGAGTVRRIDHEVTTAAPDEVDYRRPLPRLRHLADEIDGEPCRRENVRGPGRGK